MALTEKQLQTSIAYFTVLAQIDRRLRLERIARDELGGVGQKETKQRSE